MLGVGALVNLKNLSNPAGLAHIIAPLGILITVGIVVFIVISIVVKTATILILGNSKKYDLSDLLRMGLGFTPALFALGIVSALLTIPAFSLFIIPGIVVAFFLMFGSYEVILDGRGVLDAVGRSAYIVKNNFGYVFVRVLVVVGLTIITWIISAFFGKAQGGGIISWIIGIIFGLYIESYIILVYKDLESRTKDKKAVISLMPFVIVAVLGYLMLGAVIYSAAKLITNPSFQEGLKKGYNQSLQQNPNYLKNLKVQ